MTYRTTTRRALVGGLVLLALAGCKAEFGPGAKAAKNESETAAVPVEAAKVTRQPIVARYTGTASLEAERQADVVAKTSGVLLRLHVEEGDRVTAGQLLAQLDPERPRLELARAEANLKRLENDFRRSQELYAAKLTPAELHDKVRFELETQRAAHQLAELELSYTRIVAPIDGVISARMTKEGNLIQLHQALFRIDDFDPLLAVLNVPERELLTLEPGLPVTMQVDALPGRRFEGTVARVSPVVDRGTGTFRVTCEFRDESGALKSGMFGRVDVVYDERADALVIPREALMDEDGEAAVFVVGRGLPDTGNKDGEGEGEANRKPDPKAPKPKETTIAKRRAVVPGHASGDLVEIREGLAEGEQVITIGRAALREGTAIQVLEAPK